jgi:hypothetical protein
MDKNVINHITSTISIAPKLLVMVLFCADAVLSVQTAILVTEHFHLTKQK